MDYPCSQTPQFLVASEVVLGLRVGKGKFVSRKGALGAVPCDDEESFAIMTVELLIQALVRQTAILVAQLATTGGVRAPLTQIANQVFLDLVRELERLGVSRKVSADMFGLGLRTYRRKIQRVGDVSTDRGRSLRAEVLVFLRGDGVVSRAEILEHFPNDDEAQVRAVLRDLRESQLVFTLGKGTRTSYRAATPDELSALKRKRGDEGEDEFHMALMYREGPLSVEEIAERAQVETVSVEAAVTRLSAAGRIRQVDHDGQPRYQAQALTIPLGATFGWEAAVFDHFKAVVGTVLSRLRANEAAPLPADRVGGSTYTIDLWKGHPLEEEVVGTLQRLRTGLSELRQRVTEINKDHDPLPPMDRVVIYVGQYVVSETLENEKSDNEP